MISERGLKEGTIEVKWRTDAAPHNVSAATSAEAILAELETTKKGMDTIAAERRISRATAKASS